MNKKLLAGLLVVVIISLLVVVYSFKDVLFTNKVVVTYVDGCKEVYVDTVLVSDPCVAPYKYPSKDWFGDVS